MTPIHESTAKLRAAATALNEAADLIEQALLKRPAPKHKPVVYGRRVALAPGELDALRTFRESLGWTQGQLGARMGMDRCDVSKLERGHRPVTTTVLARWRAALGLETVAKEERKT